MLNRSRNTTGNVNLWLYGRSGLSYLMGMVDPSCIHGRAACSYHTADPVCEFLDQLKSGSISKARSAGDDNLRVSQRNHILRGLNDLENLCPNIGLLQLQGDGNDLSHSSRLRLGLCHNARPYGGHLRPVVRALDRCHQVSSEGRSCLQNTLCLLIDIQLRTVCGQSGIHTRRNPRSQVASDVGCAVQNDLRLELINDLGNHLCITVRRVVCQQITVCRIDNIRTGLKELLCHVAQILAEKDCT